LYHEYSNMTISGNQKIEDRRDTVSSRRSLSTMLSDTGPVSPAIPSKHTGTTHTPSRIYMGQTGKGDEPVTDEHRKDVKGLAQLFWQLHMNEKARTSGLITSSMYEYAKDALHKEIAILEALCYNECHKAGGNSGFEICTATA
jgi:hypothetical protein